MGSVELQTLASCQAELLPASVLLQLESLGWQRSGLGRLARFCLGRGVWLTGPNPSCRAAEAASKELTGLACVQVPLISSGALCRKHWRHKELNPSGLEVVSREYVHAPRKLNMFDMR